VVSRLGRARTILIAGLLLLFPFVLEYALSKRPSGRVRVKDAPLLLASSGAWLLFAVTVAAFLFRPTTMLGANAPVPGKLRALGVLAGGIGCVLLIWALRTLSASRRDAARRKRTETLVMHGPYLWMRHPCFAALAMLVVALPLLTANWLFVPVGIVLLGTAGARLPREEELLRERFGEPYAAYERRTGRFFPGMS
jgi:protein-S-isoprenylcysteine O-methyltransferase Ste14